MSLAYLGAEPGRALLIRVKNTLDLAKAQGGAAGGLAAFLVPQTIDNVVLSKMAEQFQAQLLEKGVNAEVTVVADTGSLPVKGRKDLLTGVGLGMILVGMGWAGWTFGVRKLISLVRA